VSIPRNLVLVISCISVAIVAFALVALRRTPAGTVAPPATQATVPREADAELLALERELVVPSPHLLPADLYTLRGLGPRATPPTRQRVQASLASTGELGALPEWVGLEPRRAFAATLLESKAPGDTLVLEGAPAVVPQTPATDSFTLYWQLEYASLVRRDDPALVPAEHLATLCSAALRRLERDPLESLSAAWLAAATFRAVPAAAAPDLEPRARRLYAKLALVSRVPGATSELSAARLEALASHALWRAARIGRLDSKTRRLLSDLDHGLRLGLRSGQHGAATAMAATRALRLSKAVLGDTDGVFPQ
jgi:hypothetical protein